MKFMKKAVLAFIIASCIITLCGCGAFLGLLDEETIADAAERRLDLSFDGCSVLEQWDTHGGFHGDGDAFLKLTCPDGFEGSFNYCWEKLPLTGEAYSYFYEWGGLFEHPETNERVIPYIEDGYWYFNSTGAQNFDFAIYDCANDILYYYRYDG